MVLYPKMTSKEPGYVNILESILDTGNYKRLPENYWRAYYTCLRKTKPHFQHAHDRWECTQGWYTTHEEKSIGYTGPHWDEHGEFDELQISFCKFRNHWGVLKGIFRKQPFVMYERK